MISALRQWLRKAKNASQGFHFWAIILLILLITVLYYGDLVSANRQWSWFWYIKIFEFNYRINGILFCIPLIYAALIFWWKGALATWLIAILIVLPRIYYSVPDLSSLAINISYLLIPLSIIISVALELKWREKERKTLAEKEADRQKYVSQMLKAQEDERHRISRELHDGTLQTLLVIATRAKMLGSYENVKIVPESEEQAKWIEETAISVSQELRNLSMDLRPGILDNLGLVPSLRWLVKGLVQEGINSRIEIKGDMRKLSDDIDINLFRILQESLNNIRRHSQATGVLVELEFAPDTIKLTISDNGVGFNIPKTNGELTASGKLGLAGMQQRVELLHGTFILQSEPGKGTRISIEIKNSH